MTPMSWLAEHPLVQALAWTLVHFLWQGAALGLVAATLLRAVRASAAARHAVALVALAAMLAVPAATFVYLAGSGGVAAREGSVEHAAAPAPVAAPAHAVATPPAGRADAAPPDAAGLARLAILALWAAGVLALSCRLAGGWLVARRLATRGTGALPEAVGAVVARVMSRLAPAAGVRVAASAAVAVPLVAGWLRPVVVLPFAALSSLSMAQIEALVIHELAHVRRRDYLVNLLQSVAETLLFYHPAVWWVSREVRLTRELCCDDAAVRECDRTVYASALAALAALTVPPRPALAATGGPLLERVRRVLDPQPASRSARFAGWPAAALLATTAGLLVPAGLVASPEGAARLAPAAAVGEPRPAASPAGPVEGTPAPAAMEAVPARIDGGTYAAEGQISGRAMSVAIDRQGDAGGALGQIALGVYFSDTGGLEVVVSDTSALILAVEEQAQAAGGQADEIRRLVETLRRLRQDLPAASRPELDAAIGRLERLLADTVVSRERAARLREEETRARGEETARAFERTRMAQADAAARVRREQEETLARATERLLAAEERQALRQREVSEQMRRIREQVAAEIAGAARVLRSQEEAAMRQFRERVAEQEAREREMYQAMRAGREAVQRAFETVRVKALDRRAIEDALIHRSRPVDDAAEAVRSGDVLVVEIQGEPDLPRAYLVSDEGTIRVPLVGTIEVRGLTRAAVEARLRAEIARRSGASPVVAVALRRSR